MSYRIAAFNCDMTPPVGHPLCAGWYPPADAIGDRLSAHGLVLTSDDDAPVVLCALDWAELSNRDYLRWREEIAAAVQTEPDRVAVQCTHCHDSPWPDRDAQDILDAHGFPDVIMSGDWCERVRGQVAAHAAEALKKLRPCSEVSVGEARVDRVASNRRIMGGDGKVKAVRWTKTRDPKVRAEPEGLIDPMLKTISFWHEDRRLAALHYYAVHPTSVDGTGIVTPEFVGLARNQCIEEDGGTPHIYFTGCTGNITAGKYNDGDIANREIFKGRIHDAIRASEVAPARHPLTSATWRVAPVHLPPREDLTEESLMGIIQDPLRKDPKSKAKPALMLAYLRRADLPIPITCLHLNDNIAILNLPGEAFIEYQMHAYATRPDAFVAVASYGDLGTGYITMQSSFEEGGYEPTDAFVSGASEPILKAAIENVLERSAD